jgi:hypothetical protein
MSNVTTNIKAIQPSGLSEVAVPLQFLFGCAAQSLNPNPADAEHEAFLLTVPGSEERGKLEASLPHACSKNHGFEGFKSTCIIRLPLSQKNKYFHLGNEVIRVFNARESDLQENLDGMKFADHKLISMRLAVNWDPEGKFYDGYGREGTWDLAHTILGGNVEVKKFAEGAAAGKLVGVEGSEKWEAETIKVLDAWAIRGWKGQLVAICHMEGKFDPDEWKAWNEREWSESSSRSIPPARSDGARAS